MLVVRFIENDKINACFRSGKVEYKMAQPHRVRNGIRIGPRKIRDPAGAKTRGKNLIFKFSIILYQVFYREVHLISIISFVNVR